MTNVFKYLCTHDNHKIFFNEIDVIVEFGSRKSNEKFVKEASKRNIPFVSGSTGLSKNFKIIKNYSKKYQYSGLLI